MQVHKSVEIQAGEVLAQHWDKATPPVDPEKIARRMGATVVHSYGPESGCLDITDGKATIAVNAFEPAHRQRFTIAHEIGHWVLQHGNRFRDTSANFTTGVDWMIERQANEFAACLLMPRAWVEELALRRYYTVSAMAATFGVSLIAMEYRLKNLGIVS